MNVPAQATVLILTGESQMAAHVELSLATLGATDHGQISVHVVHPETLDLSGLSAQAVRLHAWDQTRSLARVTNELVGSGEFGEVVLLATAGASLDPTDVADAASLVDDGGRVLRGWPLGVAGLTPDSLLDLAPEVRSERGANAVGVTVRDDTMGVVGMRRDDYVTLRGLEETLSDPDDLLHDIHQRARRWGLQTGVGPTVLFAAKRLNALPSSSQHAAATPGQLTRIFRNLTTSMGGTPLVSIVISTCNRSDYLADCIHSILAQSFGDFELILVDDGSTDATEQVVAEFSDPRIRYFKRENAGISAARNFGLERARGALIAVHDDDDLMLPWRLESQLAALESGDHGCFGVSVHFDDTTGETHDLVHRLFTMQTALRYGNNPTHPTWLIRRDVVAQFGYDETLESGVDNNLALRMIRSGVRLRHTGVPLILRRMHAGQITRTAGETQKASASMSRRMLHFANGAAQNPNVVGPEGEWLPAEKVRSARSRVLPYLPDHLVSRDVTIRVPWPLDEAVRFAEPLGALKFISSSFGRENGPGDTVVTVAGVTWPGLVTIRDAGLTFEATAVEAGAQDDAAGRAALERWSLEEFASDHAAGDHVVRLVSSDSEALAAFVSGSGRPGVAYQATREGEQLMAALLYAGGLEDALGLVTQVQTAGPDVLDASVMLRGDVSRNDLVAALASGAGVTA